MFYWFHSTRMFCQSLMFFWDKFQDSISYCADEDLVDQQVMVHHAQRVLKGSLRPNKLCKYHQWVKITCLVNSTLLVRFNLKRIFFSLSFLKDSFAPAAYYSSKVIIFYLWHPDRPLPWKRLWSWKQASWFALRSEFQSVQLLFTEGLKTHLIRQIWCYRGKIKDLLERDLLLF